MSVLSQRSDILASGTKHASKAGTEVSYERIARLALHLAHGRAALLASKCGDGFRLQSAVGCEVRNGVLLSEHLSALWRNNSHPDGGFHVRDVNGKKRVRSGTAGLVDKSLRARLTATWSDPETGREGILCILSTDARALEEHEREGLLELAAMASEVADEGPVASSSLPVSEDNGAVLASLMELQFEFARKDIGKSDLPVPIARRALELTPAPVAFAGIAEENEIIASAVEGSFVSGGRAWGISEVPAWYARARKEKGFFEIEPEQAPSKAEPWVRYGIPVWVKSSCAGVIGLVGLPAGQEAKARRVLSLLAEVVEHEIERCYEREALRQSEERHRTLLSHLPVGVYRSTPEGRILEANEAMAELVGSPDVSTLRRVVVDDLFVDYRDRIQQMERLGEQETGVSEYRLRRLDGEKVWVRDHPRAIRNDEGEVVHYDGVIMDVSKRRLAERLLAESEARLRAITEHASDVIAIFDEQGRAKYISGAAEEIFGLPPHVLEGETGVEYVHYDDRERLGEALQESLDRPGQIIEIEFRICRADGSWRYLNLRGKNLMHQSGIEGILCVIRDVTEKKEFEKQLVTAKEKAEEMARVKSAFLANMSHEIRTPLTGILGFAEVLADEVGEQHREFVELIQQGGRRLSETLNSVLDLAKLQAGEVEIELEPVTLSAIVCEAVQLFEPVADKKNLSLRIEKPDPNLTVRGDEAGLGRILANLLSNALKFTEEGHVSISTFEEVDTAGIVVEDTGIGMSKEFLSSLFDEFKQESTGLNRTHEGAGLGLTITKRLVDMMDGTIDVESEEGQGTTFHVALPKCDVGPDAEEEESDSPHQHPDGAEETAQILVVEDNRDSRLLIEHLLSSYWDLHIVSNADEALVSVRDQQFDLLLVDINLGVGLDGTDLLQKIRSRESYAEVPAVALTAFAMPGDRERFLSDGFDDYLAKPFTRESLIDTIRAALARKPKP